MALNLRIGGRLWVGFAVIVLILIGAVGASIYGVSQIEKGTTRIVTIRMPAADGSAQLISSVNASLAALRGWMLTGNENFKKERAGTWADIARIRKDMDEVAKRFTNEKNKQIWAEVKGVLDEFAAAQAKAEAIAHTPDELPALKVLNVEAAPLAGTIAAEITRMIDEEQKLEATPQRKTLLGQMADVRGTMGLALANIRAYLITGDKQFTDTFNTQWQRNETRFKDLSGNQAAMTATQREAFKKFSDARAAFAPLPAKMFEIRASRQWNMAQYTLVTETAPRANKLLDLLDGPVSADGIRKGGLLDSQKELLKGDAADNARETAQLMTLEWTLLFLGIALSSAIAFFTTRSIVRPVTDMTAAMTELSQGKLETPIPALDKKDEIGEMARSVQVFKENMVKTKQMEEEAKQTETRQREERRKMMLTMADDFEAKVGGIVQTVASASNEMQSTAQSLSASSEETTRQAAAVAAASEQASANVQTVASASEELSASIAEIGKQVEKSTNMAKSATEKAETTSRGMTELAAAADKIGEVVALINDIADQTNLLALNATIEAARAGEAGKGFAVVASEVKNLANQVGKATEEISQQIKGVQERTNNAVTSMNAIVESIRSVNEVSAAIAAAVEEQSAATREISSNVQQASAGTREVSQNIQGVNQAALEAGAGSNQVLEASRQLSRDATMLQDSVKAFIAQIRAS